MRWAAPWWRSGRRCRAWPSRSISVRNALLGTGFFERNRRGRGDLPTCRPRSAGESPMVGSQQPDTAMPPSDPAPEVPPTPRDDAEMFELAPVSLWIEDYSGVKALFEAWRRAGITSLRDHFAGYPARIKDCAGRIRVLKVNRKTLALFGAADLPELVGSLDRIFRDDMLKTHVDELVQLWSGQTEFFSNTVNYTLQGDRLDIQLKGAIVPGYEDTWSRVLVAIEDVTERENVRRDLSNSENYARGLFEHSPVSLWVEDFSSVKRLLDEVRGRGIE